LKRVQEVSRLHQLLLIMRPKDGDLLISPEKQRQLRMGVGMLLYSVRHSCPDISISVRELSSMADGATEGHFKALYAQSSMY
jgi:hypothetical protein